MNPTLAIWLELLGILTLEIALLTGISALIQRVLPSPHWRKMVWQVCIVAMVVLLAAELTGFARHLLDWSRNSAGTQRAAYPRPVPDKESASAADEGHKANAFAQPILNPRVELLQSPKLGYAGSPGNRHRTSEEPVRESIPILCFGLVWLAGMIIVLGRRFFCRTIFLCFRSKWKIVSCSELHARARALAETLGVRRRFQLIESAYFSTPIAFGVVRPTIGLPAGFTEKFERTQQDVMLLHELAHLWAKDPFWMLLAEFATAVLWWHPLSWWARRQLQSANELAADEASLLLENGPDALAECLVKLSSRLSQPTPFGTLGMAGTAFNSGLGRRVERLIELNNQVWSPPCPRRSALIKGLGPLVLTVISILCFAWVVPTALTKGENMHTMKQTWKRSLAAFALLATLGSEQTHLLATEPAESAAVKPEPSNKIPVPVGGTAPVPVAETDVPQALHGRHGLPGGTESALPSSETAGLTSTIPKSPTGSREKQSIQAKLERITMDSVKYDGLPLGEVINNLVEISAASDPDKLGINFVINREAPKPSSAPIDPTTGLPVAMTLPVESMDLTSVTVKIVPALKHVRLIDVLNVLVKTADYPIKYSVEDYGVVFSTDADKSVANSGNTAASQPLSVMTFKVNTNTFFAGLESTFGIKARPGKAQQSQETQVELRKLLEQLGIPADTRNTSIFYNDLTGILMVRTKPEDTDVVAAAIKTLGGVVYVPQSTAGF
jgi:beta-lactamase regulating signal transducer with metallopeptidase domain